MATLFCVSWTYYFMGSLLSIPLHRLELISFSSKIIFMPWQHFFMFLALKNLSRVSLHSKTLHRFQMISFFANTWPQVLPWQHFFLFI